MKKILSTFLLVSFWVLNSLATNYYVANAGNDGFAGTSPSTPWKTIDKVNSAFPNMTPGDSILFKKGDVFVGTLLVGKSGTVNAPFIISCYGSTGANPKITGYITLSTWTLVSSGIYQSSFSTGKTNFINVELDGKLQRMGRYPNADQPALVYESFSGNTSITDNDLSTTVNWTGAEVVARKYRWVWDRAVITANSNKVITYSKLGVAVNVAPVVQYAPLVSGYGYFIQNDVRTLDKLGEWYFKPSTKYLQVYFGTDNPSNHILRAASLDYLLNINGKNNITIKGLDFEGANISAIYSATVAISENLKILNCNIEKVGYAGVQVNNYKRVVVEDVYVNLSLSTGIQLTGFNCTNYKVNRCTVTNNFIFQGMGDYNNDPSAMRAIRVGAIDTTVVSNCVIRNCGFTGIAPNGSNLDVFNNVIDTFNTQMDDNGAIYILNGVIGAYGNSNSTFTNRTFRNNIISNGIGNSYATLTPSGAGWSNGIYLDGEVMNVDILNNVISNCARIGIVCNNPVGTVGVKIKGNILHNDSIGVRISRNKWGGVERVTIDSNYFIPKTSGQTAFTYTTDTLSVSLQADLHEIKFSRNKYYLANPLPFIVSYTPVPLAPFSFERWAAYSTNDSGSVVINKFAEYNNVTLLGGNKCTNPNFTSNTTGVSVQSASGSWDNTNKISGGSLKVTFTAPAPNSLGVALIDMGAVTSAKKYILRFKTLGTTADGVLNIYIRDKNTIAQLTPKLYGSFGTTVKTHEFLVASPTTSGSASMVIGIDRGSGTTYIDDVFVYEVNADSKGGLTDSIRVVTNPTASNLTVNFPFKYSNVANTQQYTTDTLAPFTGKVYLYFGILLTGFLISNTLFTP